jgi:hypothetical protein
MLADVNTYYTEKPLLRSAKLLSLTMAAILFPRAFSHGPFPTGLFPRAAGSGSCRAKAGSRPKSGPPQIL